MVKLTKLRIFISKIRKPSKKSLSWHTLPFYYFLCCLVWISLEKCGIIQEQVSIKWNKSQVNSTSTIIFRLEI